jgi:tetratricopeptide (TPR) repeat protein
MPANDLDDTEVAAIAAYMRVLNVVQNVNEAGLAIEQTWNNPTSSIGDGRLAFAETELEDAAQVLREGALHKPARARIERARKHLKKAFQTKSNDPKARKAMALALYEIQAARGSMVLIHGSPDDEWTERYLNPSWSDVIEGTLGGAEQSAEEAAFEALLEELGSGD